MKRTDTFIIDIHAGNTDICAAVRITRWIPGVAWSDFTKLQKSEFTVWYDDQILTDVAIIFTLRERGFRGVVIASFPSSPLVELSRPFIRKAKKFRASYECHCRAQLLPCPVCEV
jgi:hypothetical protein